MNEIPFTDQQLKVLLPSLEAAVADVKDIQNKTLASIDGDIYTNLRREIVSRVGKGPLTDIVIRRKKYAGRVNPKQWEFIQKLLIAKRNARMEGVTNDPIQSLRLSLAGMTAAAEEMEKINKEADQLLAQIKLINHNLTKDDEDGAARQLRSTP